MRPRLIPTLLLRGRGLYKTARFRDPAYVGDPINAVRIFNEKGADELVLFDIQATPGRRGPDLGLIAEIVSEAFIPICYGGGVTSTAEFEALLKVGVEKVAINSAATGNMSLVSEVARLFGNQSVVVGIDVQRTLLGQYRRVTHGGAQQQKDPLLDAVRAEEAGAGELFLNAVDRDGTMQGYDTKLVRLIAAATSIPVIACGGAGKLEDMLRIVSEGGASAAAAGSVFVFQGKHKAVLITYPDEHELQTTNATLANAK